MRIASGAWSPNWRSEDVTGAIRNAFRAARRQLESHAHLHERDAVRDNPAPAPRADELPGLDGA